MANNYTNTSIPHPMLIHTIVDSTTNDHVSSHGPFHWCRCNRGTAIDTKEDGNMRGFDPRSIFRTIPTYILCEDEGIESFF